MAANFSAMVESVATMAVNRLFTDRWRTILSKWTPTTNHTQNWSGTRLWNELGHYFTGNLKDGKRSGFPLGAINRTFRWCPKTQLFLKLQMTDSSSLHFHHSGCPQTDESVEKRGEGRR
jgi:hypothetical protein